jgi:hypothetical protein
MLSVIKAAGGARGFLTEVKDEDGAYRLNRWPEVSDRREVKDARTAVARLRVVQRLTIGFLDPVDDAIFLTAGLRNLGIPASFHLGRELAPIKPPAGYFPWVQHGDDVVSTSLPVRDEYIEIHRSVA